MKPEVAYKMIKVWSLTNATIMVILLLIQCRSLLNVLGIITIVPTFFIGIIGGYETYSYDYTNLLKNVTEKRKKEMPYVNWDKAFKNARKNYLWGLIGMTFVNLLFSAFMIFMLWIRFHEGKWLFR